MKQHKPRRHPNPVYANTTEQCSACGYERVQRVAQKGHGAWFNPDYPPETWPLNQGGCGSCWGRWMVKAPKDHA